MVFLLYYGKIIIMKHLEIENKYLLSHKKALRFVKRLEYFSVQKIEQAYCQSSDDITKRVRKIGKSTYILTIKKGSGKVREEYEKYISRRRYKKLKKKRIGKVIKKKRYVFELDGYVFELDIFKGTLKGLAFLEVEFDSTKKLDSFVLPKPLKKMVIKDVSDDKRFTNASLATNIKKRKDLKQLLKSYKS